MVKITKEFEIDGYAIRKYHVSPEVKVELFKESNLFELVEVIKFETLEQAFEYLSNLGFK